METDISSQSDLLLENARLLAVKRYMEFQINREKDLQDIVMLASHICESPIALITLMDKEVQWIKAAVGIEADQMPRETSFCTQAIKIDQVTVVNDARLDERFATLPVVTGNPNIRFYASANLKTHDGYHVGTLCVFDPEPHTFSKVQQDCLAALAKQVSHLMELDLSLKKSKEQVQHAKQQNELILHGKIKLRAVLDSALSYHLLVGRRLEIMEFNKGASDFIREVLGAEIRIDSPVKNFLGFDTTNRFVQNFNRALTGETIRSERFINFKKINYSAWWDITYTPAMDNAGKIIGVSFNALNIQERKLQEEKLNIQHQALRKIAQIQSHGLRAPVSSILGIMNLIKESGYNPQKEYLLMMDEAVNQLDEKIQTIVNHTEGL